MTDGPCTQTDPEIWYPEQGRGAALAKKICLTCEVREKCLDYALTNREKFGVWGGKSERERHQMLRDMKLDNEFEESEAILEVGEG